VPVLQKICEHLLYVAAIVDTCLIGASDLISLYIRKNSLLLSCYCRGAILKSFLAAVPIAYPPTGATYLRVDRDQTADLRLELDETCALLLATLALSCPVRLGEV
jgi:hypothetical protein